MSTAGKVLVVLVMLTSLVFVLLVAKVADLNSNWGKALDTEVKKYAKAEDDLKSAVAALAKHKAGVDAVQVEMEKQTALLRRDLSAAERIGTQAKEALTRVNFQLASVEGQVKAAQAGHEQRVREVAAQEKQKADSEASVRTLEGQNAELLATVERLRGEFKATLADNKERLAQIRKSGQRQTHRVSLPR
jgi:chromosome segregation ATPase